MLGLDLALALLLSGAPLDAETASATPALSEVIDTLLTEIQSFGPVDRMPMRAGATLSLDEVLRSVEQSYPELLVLEQKVVAAEAKQMSATGIFDPKLSVALTDRSLGYYDAHYVDAQLEQLLPLWGSVVYGGYRRSAGTLPVYELETETLDGGELRLGLNVPLLRGGAIDAKRAKQAESEQTLRMREQEHRAGRLVFLRLASNAYWTWVASVEEYRVQRELLGLAETRDAQVASMVERGAVPELERLENLRAILARRDGVIKARRKVEESSLKLSLFARDRDGVPTAPGPEQAPPLRGGASGVLNLEEGLARASRSRPEMLRAEAELAQAKIGLALAQNQVLPTLDVKVEGSKDLGEGDASQRQSLDPGVLKLGAKLSLPLLLREGRGEANAAEAEVETRLLQMRLLADKVRAEVRDTYSQNLAARQRVTVDRSGLSAARAAAEAERQRFALGATSLLVVNLREQAAADAEVKLIQATRDARQAEIDWEAVTVSARFSVPTGGRN